MQDTIMEMHSKNVTLLIDLISCTTPACFSTFYQCGMVFTLVKNLKFFCVLVCIRHRLEVGVLILSSRMLAYVCGKH